MFPDSHPRKKRGGKGARLLILCAPFPKRPVFAAANLCRSQNPQTKNRIPQAESHVATGPEETYSSISRSAQKLSSPSTRSQTSKVGSSAKRLRKPLRL